MTWDEFEEVMRQGSDKLTPEELAALEFIINNYKYDWI